MVFNLAQGIESFILAYLSEKEFEKAAIYGVSTLISTAVGDIGMGWFSGSEAEKFMSEPIVAGLLSGVGMYAFKKKEKDRFLSPFARGFAYTGASAGINSVLASNYIAGPKTELKKGDVYTTPSGVKIAVDKDVTFRTEGYQALRTYVDANKENKDLGYFASNTVQ